MPIIKSNLSKSAKYLPVTEFGKQLIETKDLDPVYVVVWKAEFSPIQLKKWLLAYWCCYHCGTSSWVLDQPNYWKALHTVAASKGYPRASERRHFRGQLAVKTVEALEKLSVLERFEELCKGDNLGVGEVIRRVRTWYNFGPWIAFKVADMLERLAIKKVAFTDTDTFLFDSPKEGARLVTSLYAKGEHVTGDLFSRWALDYLKQNLGSMLAPPRYERPINGQELETILCKFVGHYNGKYKVGKDLEEVRHGLERFKDVSPTARKLLGVVPCL